MQVRLGSSFARPGSAPIWGGKKGEFRDWTSRAVDKTNFVLLSVFCLSCLSDNLQLFLAAFHLRSFASLCSTENKRHYGVSRSFTHACHFL